MSSINNTSPVGGTGYGAPALSPQETAAKSLPSFRGEEDLGLSKDFEVPQSTSSRSLRKPDSLELFAAVRSGLALVSDGSLKNPDRYV